MKRDKNIIYQKFTHKVDLDTLKKVKKAKDKAKQSDEKINVLPLPLVIVFMIISYILGHIFGISGILGSILNR